MSDIVKKLENHLNKEKEKRKIRYEELKALINECKSAEDPLTDLAKEIKKMKEESGYKRTSVTYPVEWNSLLTELKKLGKRETGFSNLSLMMNIAMVEFLLRHKTNPQPKLTDSIGLTLPSTIRSNFSEEFKNYIRNLPKDRAREVMLKNAKYLALGTSEAKQEGTKEEQKQERETEEKENGEKEENRKLVQTKQTKEQEQYKKYVKALKYVQHYMDTGKFEKAQAVINDLPLDKLRKQHRKMVQDWQETLQKHLQQLEEPIQLRELSKEDNDVELKPLSVADKDEIFGEEYLKYKKRIAAAETQLEQGNRTKAKTLVENLNITDAPGDRLEYRLRKVKEELGVKY